MADLEEVAALLHLSKSIQEHGDSYPNIKKAVLDKLRAIEAEYEPQKPEEAEEIPAKETETEDEDDA